ESRIEKEESGRGPGSQAIHTRRQVEDEAELADDESEEHHPVAEDGLQERRRSRDRRGHHGRDSQPHGHPSIDLPQKRRDALGAAHGRGRESRSGRHREIVVHSHPPGPGRAHTENDSIGRAIPRCQFTWNLSASRYLVAIGSPGFSASAPSNSATASASSPRAARSRPRFRYG